MALRGAAVLAVLALALLLAAPSRSHHTLRVKSVKPNQQTTPGRRRQPDAPAAPAAPAVEASKVPNARASEPKSYANGPKKVVCYFTNWAWYRPGIGKFVPENIDAELCTHIVYSFAALDDNALIMKVFDGWADLDNKFYQKVAALKSKGKKVTIAIGGWKDSGSAKYSTMVNDPAKRKNFIDNAVRFVGQYGFDGLDLDWEYPKCWQNACERGPASDKAGFAALVRELRAAFAPKGWLLSAAVGASRRVGDEAYDVPALSQSLDWIGLMAYDYHGQWDGKTGHVSPLHAMPGDAEPSNTQASVQYWLSKGAAADKLVLGVPMYGQSFTLSSAGNHGLNAPTSGGGTAGEYTGEGGLLAYYEICDRVKKQGWQVARDAQGRIGPYAFNGNQWVGYDDVDDVRRKAQFVKQLGLGGAMVWAIDLDDFNNQCGCGRYPLLRALSSELRGLTTADGNCT